MAVTTRTGASLTRRRFLTTAASSAAITVVGGIAKPYLSRAADRPLITHGIQSGDVSVDSGVVWARADRPARMLVEVATTDSFRNVRSSMFVDALPETDFTANALVEGLPGGQDMFYRVRFQDHSFPGALSEPQVGRFRTAPTERRSISFVWSGDTGAWGIDEARGGMRTYATLLRNRPDFFVHCGDTIYADGPIAAEVKMEGDAVWKNVVTEEVSKVAETLKDLPLYGMAVFAAPLKAKVLLKILITAINLFHKDAANNPLEFFDSEQAARDWIASRRQKYAKQ